MVLGRAVLFAGFFSCRASIQVPALNVDRIVVGRVIPSPTDTLKMSTAEFETMSKADSAGFFSIVVPHIPAHISGPALLKAGEDTLAMFALDTDSTQPSFYLKDLGVIEAANHKFREEHKTSQREEHKTSQREAHKTSRCKSKARGK